MDLSNPNLSEDFGPLQKLPVVRLPKKRRKFGESGEYSDVDRVLKQIVEDAYRYAKSVTPIRPQKKGFPAPDPLKYTSFSQLKGPTINKLAETLLSEPDIPKAKPKLRSRILPQWKGGIYNEPAEPSKCKIYSHTDVPGCSSAPVASEELCLFCNDQKDGSLSETEETNAFHNTMKYGSSDGSILNTLPAVYKPDCESKMFVEKESLIETKTTVRTRSARKRMQTKVLPPLEFKKEIKMEDFMLPSSFFVDLGMPVPDEVQAHWDQKEDVSVKHTDTNRVEENLFPTPSLTASETSEYRAEDVPMVEVGAETVPAPIASSSPLPVEEKDVVRSHTPKPAEICSPEQLIQELKKCYQGVPPENIRTFHADFIERLKKLRDGLLEQRESEIAAASVCFQDFEDVEEAAQRRYEQVDEPMEVQQEAAPAPSPASDVKQQQVRVFSGFSDTTEEDLEEFAEFFPDYPSRISSGAGFVDSPPAVLRRPSDDVIDVVGVEEPCTSMPMHTEALNNSHPSWYSDSDPSTSFNCSPESSSENNLTIEVVSPVKTTESWTRERQPNLIIRSSYSSDDEVYGQYSYNARFSPVTDTGLMPSPIASQQ